MSDQWYWSDTSRTERAFLKSSFKFSGIMQLNQFPNQNSPSQSPHLRGWLEIGWVLTRCTSFITVDFYRFYYYQYYYCHYLLLLLLLLLLLPLSIIYMISVVKGSNSSSNRETYYPSYYIDQTQIKDCYFSNYWRHHPPRIQSWRHLR